MSSLAAKLKKGTKVKITAKGQYFNQPGVVKYVGPIEEKKAQGDYVGLQLQKPIGKNNGTHGGKEYFKTKPNMGIFLKPTSLAYLDGSPVAVPDKTKAPAASNKLSKDLQQAQKPEKVEQQKVEQPEKVEPIPEQKHETKETKETKEIKESSSAAQSADVDELKKRIKALQDQNRGLKIQNQKVKYTVKQKDEGKQKNLQEQIDFFKAQKEAIQKEKADLKKKNAQLNAELEEYAENMGMVDNLTIKIQNLEAKNEKYKQELETANSQLKNYRMMGQNKGKDDAELNENIKILNQTVTLLQSDLKDMTERTIQLEEELKKRQTIEAQSKKLERKLKQKEEQLIQMSNQLQLVSDAAAFAQKLTLDMLKKDQELKQKTVKLSDFISKIQLLEQEMAINKQFTQQLNKQIFHQEQMIDKSFKEIEEKNKHITQLNRQIQKYKKKICEIAQSNEALSTISSQIQEKQEIPIMKNLFGDQYQSKYFNILKVNNDIRKNELKHLIQFSQIRNQVGVYILNLAEALPESFTSKLYPEVITTLTALKSANDKLYYIFITISDILRNRSDIFSNENKQLAQWLILLMKQVITLYGCLHKVEYSFTTAQNQDQISEILDHRILRDQIRKINNFALQLLQKFVDDNISASIDLEQFISSIQKFDEINMSIKKHFSNQYETKMNLCTEGMETVSNILEAVMKYKHKNPLNQNAEVDNSLDLFVKCVLGYVKQCCMNPYLRYKSQMKQYLQGLNLINNILSDIGVEDNYHELNSLYSETENIKLLRQTILTTQYHANALESDLKDIVYPSQVSKIQTLLPGKFWVQRIKLIKQQLLRVKQVSQQKIELQHVLNEAKKKNLILQRDIKDKQSTKQLYERRIGELQLKVQQVTSIQNQNRRQAEKLKSYEDANKLIQEQIVALTKKNKLYQQESKKIKQKYDTLQTETMMRNIKQRSANMMSTEDVANLAIFKNSIKESNQLRTYDVKKKLMVLKQSPIYMLKQTKKVVEQDKKVTTMRAKIFDQISKFAINDPFTPKKNPNEANLDLILLQISKYKKPKQEIEVKPKSIKVGTLLIHSISENNQKINDTGLSIVVN